MEAFAGAVSLRTAAEPRAFATSSDRSSASCQPLTARATPIHGCAAGSTVLDVASRSVLCLAFAGFALHGRRTKRFRGSGRCESLSRPCEGAGAEPTTADSQGLPWSTKLRRWWKKNGKLDRKKMSGLGLACLLSYGFVSNASLMICIHIATFSAMRATGASPLSDTAALKQFGITYAGLYLVNSIIRPLRFGLSLGLSPAFDRLVAGIQSKLSCKKRTAIGVTVFLVNVIGTFTILFSGLFLVSWLCSVPLDVSKFGLLIKAGKAARAGA
eukprot:TRINITY_DN114915_c0_g1_i1.p1 TRINITY_DN114915_c0_g1~~TRINITY_DN114915_c0_g1_i1.p1  ORF type:complete len:271 (-),score=30.37 TRINITY_DN114915_c0_g1_i1:174-986(-)